MESFHYKYQHGFTLLGVLALVAATVAAGVVGYQYVDHARKIESPAGIPSPTTTVSSSATTITVIDSITKAPIPNVTLIFTTNIVCIQVVGVVCPEPTPIVVKTDENGKFIIDGELPGDSVAAEAPGYELSEKVEISFFDTKLQTVTQKNTISLPLKPL